MCRYSKTKNRRQGLGKNVWNIIIRLLVLTRPEAELKAKSKDASLFTGGEKPSPFVIKKKVALFKISD